jgi:ABC-type polysaccharide/polyol phosphate transport system ATPase subunit
MQKGILLVLNNFNQISNELLVSLKSLSYESKITLNQKSIRANAGFKILGIVSGERNNKSKTTIGKMISHFTLPSKGYE